MEVASSLYATCTVHFVNNITSTSLLKPPVVFVTLVLSRPEPQRTANPAISESVLKLSRRKQVVPAEASGTTHQGHPLQTFTLGGLVLKVLSSLSYIPQIITNLSYYALQLTSVYPREQQNSEARTSFVHNPTHNRNRTSTWRLHPTRRVQRCSLTSPSTTSQQAVSSLSSTTTSSQRRPRTSAPSVPAKRATPQSPASHCTTRAAVSTESLSSSCARVVTLLLAMERGESQSMERSLRMRILRLSIRSRSC